MPTDRSELLWVTAGSLVITAGSGMAGLFAFRDRVVPVVVGFVLFFTGYRLSQVGVHRDSDQPIVDTERMIDAAGNRGRLAARTALLGIGAGGIGFGVTTFAQTIVTPSLSRAVLSGVTSIGGYMFAHLGMNDTLL